MANNKNITFNQLEASMTKVKAEIDKKANTNHGTHVPTTGTANNATYLRNDNQWHKIVPSDIGAAPISHGDHVTYSSTSPSAPGTASAGSAANVSRGDHVHPLQTTVSGNAGTATKLQNARNIKIGNTSKSFNGTADVTWTLSEIGAAPSSHGHNYLNVKGTNTINSTANDTTANWGAQNNSVHWYTAAGQLNDQPSQWGYLVNIGQSSEAHQIWMAQAGGDLSHRGGNSSGWNGSWKTILDSSNYSTWAAAKNHTHNYAASNHTHNYAGSSSAGGNANAAVKLATARSINGTNFDGSGNITTANWGTARTLTVGNTGKTVNGSGNVSWSLSEIGALPTAGGTVSGNLNVTGAFSIGGKKITINSSAPSSPAVGDIWIKI